MSENLLEEQKEVLCDRYLPTDLNTIMITFFLSVISLIYSHMIWKKNDPNTENIWLD